MFISVYILCLLYILTFLLKQLWSESINFLSIFKNKSVISSISAYFENKEFPIICYKYNESIRSTAVNYYKLVTELDIENSIPDS